MSETIIQSEVTGPEAPTDEVVDQQDELLAGKFKSQDDLVAAYKELEGKLGSTDAPKGEAEVQSEEAPAPTAHFPAEKTDEMKAYEVDAYGPEMARVFDAAGMDAKSVSEEFYATGVFPEDAYAALEKQGYSRTMVESYLAGTAGKTAANEVTSQAEVKAIKDRVGGDDEYGKMMGWAANNLSEEEATAFNAAVSNGKESAMWAVEAMHNRFTQQMGSEPNLLGGRAANLVTGDRFQSAAELTAAMKDPRYKKDEAYRQDVANKLQRSNVFGKR